jgi:tetratricopeptide (TPR) repeat protein/tRNA A-37 threonylcarbamoyl transferase component Bud32
VLHRTYLGSQKERDNFLQEAQLLEMLKHPNILPIHDVGIDDGIPYFVVEYAPNGSLRDRLQDHHLHPLPVDEALMILTQVGQGLSHAHQQNIIHRDLKPENILFNARDDALLADFGIAVVLSTPRTSPVNVIGTPLYMAPEQFDGMISKRSDQYALACIAYEMVTGRNPFVASSAVSMALKHMTEPPPAPTQFNTYLPIPVERAILKALSKERADRYPDVAAFIAALHMLPSQKTKEQWLKEGHTLHDSEHYLEALVAYERALQLDPNYTDAYDARGDAFICLNRYQEALAAFEKTIQLDPTYAHAYEGKGNILYNLKRYQEALVAYERAIRLDSNSSSAYFGKGDTLFYLRRYQEALLAFQRTIQLDPSYFPAHIGKCWTLWYLKRYDEALAAAEQALRLEPTLAAAYIGKGIALFKLKRYQEALDAHEQAIKLGSDLADLVYAYDGKGQALWKLRRLEGALQAFDRALELNPNHASSHNGRGNILYDLRRYREALQAYEHALQLHPQFVKAYNNKGAALYELRRYEDALTAYDQAIALQPGKAISHYYRCRALKQLGRLEEAQRAYEKARQLGYAG